MTFPVVEAATPTADPSATQTHSINLGSPVAGELLVVFFGSTSAGGPVLPHPDSGSGWLAAQEVGTFLLRQGAFAKIATGSDALTILTPSSVRMVSVCYRVSGHGSALAGPTFAAGSSGSGNPPNLAMSGSAQDALFLAACLTDTSIASAAPSGYGTLTTASVNNAFLATAHRTLNGTSDDPGTFTNSSQAWMAATVAIPEFFISSAGRLTQESVEVLSAAAPAARLSQIATEIVSQTTSAARLTQLSVELISDNAPAGIGAQPSMLFIAT